MTSITPATRIPRTVPAGRELSVDLVRVCCVLTVVVLHSLMVGLGTDAAGHVSQGNPVQAQPWFPVASWFGQIMPVFFVLGGFASLKSWRSVQRRGGSAADFYRARLLRLASPALGWYLIVGGLLWAAVALGFPFALGDLLAGGLGMPLWFLAAYLITQALVPGLALAHDRAPLRTVGALLAASVVVDLARYASGVTAIGLLNLVFVWALVQQLGFFFADGSLHRIPRRLLPVIAVVAFAAVGLLGLTGRYSPDMLTNLNPPTVPLVLIGVGQTALFLLLQPALDRLMATRPAQAVVLFLGTRLMTIYLWHLLFVILVAALVLVAPGSIPATGTAGWWWARIPGDALVLGALLLASFGLARFERGPARVGPAPSVPLLVVAAVLAIAPPFFAMEFRLNLLGFVWGAAMLGAAVLIARGRVSRA
ncbi:MAG TPA: acyltransferase [Amnibacterium sp.]|uniref:acyltransferase family protein n=1 Tax=Amnibacterium sp. TaxID=1872496 RepID=UPI002F92BFEA